MRCVFVYIEEAHAVDEWPIGSTVVETQHRTVADRLAAARRLDLSERWTLALDSMQNSFSAAYSPWPFRYYMIDAAQRVRLIAQPVGAALPLGELWTIAADMTPATQPSANTIGEGRTEPITTESTMNPSYCRIL